jgi:hypothetical protein
MDLKNIKQNFKYENIVKELNTIFCNIDTEIKQEVEQNLNIKTRNRDLKYTDTLIYKFLYSIPDTTKLYIVSSQNFKNNTSLSRTAYNYRENQIPLSFYTELYKKISTLYKNLMMIKLNEPIIFACDGTFNNTNSKNEKDILETSLNMGYYDITNDLPLEISLEGCKKKNNELSIFKKYINSSNIPKNSILILDRAYCSYEFIDFLIKKQYKFVIRFRNNCKNFNKIKNINDVRVIKYFDEFENKIPYDKFEKYIKKSKNKGKYKVINVENPENIKKLDNYKFKYANIKMLYEYTLITNIPEIDKNDDEIKKIYKQRWDIEIFFKLLKYNFKFEHLKEHNEKHNDEQYRKLYLINLIVIYLYKIIDKTYFYNNDIKKNKQVIQNNKIIKYVYKSNKSNIIKGVYNIIDDIIKGNILKDNFIKVCNLYVKYSFVKLGEIKERKAKTPFLKWYVKGHSNRSLMCKFIEAYILKDVSKLNKNTKVLYNICTITLFN